MKGFDSIYDAFICTDCIGDKDLRNLLESPTEVECSFCGETQSGVTLEDLADVVDRPLRKYMQTGEERPHFSSDSDELSHYEEDGESLEAILEQELAIPYEASEALAEILIENDRPRSKGAEDPFFSEEHNYHRRAYSSSYNYEWEEFSARIKHERRFFDNLSLDFLDRILGGPGSTAASDLPTFEIGPGTQFEIPFRARNANSETEALQILKNPAAELGPPPLRSATAGRMNAAGISVFYGALSPDTALAEVRPSVGSIVVVGGFRSGRRLRLLDLPQIGVVFTGSLFAPDYEDREERASFLESFHTLMAQPIQPSDTPLDYIPTQAVAEYVANILMLDGILYASAQMGAVPEIPEPSPYVTVPKLSIEELAQHNVVLLGAASRVVKTSSDASNDLSLDDGTLTVQADTIHSHLVTAVRYSHERHFIFDPSDGMHDLADGLRGLRVDT